MNLPLAALLVGLGVGINLGFIAGCWFASWSREPDLGIRDSVEYAEQDELRKRIMGGASGGTGSR